MKNLILASLLMMLSNVHFPRHDLAGMTTGRSFGLSERLLYSLFLITWNFTLHRRVKNQIILLVGKKFDLMKPRRLVFELSGYSQKGQLRTAPIYAKMNLTFILSPNLIIGPSAQ